MYPAGALIFVICHVGSQYLLHQITAKTKWDRHKALGSWEVSNNSFKRVRGRRELWAGCWLVFHALRYEEVGSFQRSAGILVSPPAPVGWSKGSPSFAHSQPQVVLCTALSHPPPWSPQAWEFGRCNELSVLLDGNLTLTCLTRS